MISDCEFLISKSEIRNLNSMPYALGGPIGPGPFL